MKKRALSFLLTLVMVLSLIPTVAMADESNSQENGNDNATEQPVEPAQEKTLQARINALPTAEQMVAMETDEQNTVYEEVSAIYDALEGLSEEELAEVDQTPLEAAASFFNQQVMPLEEPEEPVAGKAIYVSKDGNDETGNGSLGTPYASLAKAAEVINKDEGKDYIIYVMSDLTMTECARFYNKNLTITSGDGGPYTVTRGDVFATQSDLSRSWYNPAMIEAQADTEGGEYGLTLKNIILDDGGKHMGTVFAQAISGEGKENNAIYVQDAMIASNATVPCTITLGEGAILRNFGGMSAVRVTAQAKLVMESGSKIEDTTVTDRVKGETVGSAKSNGPAGAIWVQGGTFTMNEGAEISNVVGRVVYVDGGTASINGTISKIKADADMWQGINGCAVHLRNYSNAVLKENAVIQDVENGYFIYVNTSDLTLEDGSILKNGNEAAVYSVDHVDSKRNNVVINGEITGVKNTKAIHPLQIANTNVTIGKTANIHDNTAYYGALYLQKNATADIYGKICDNKASGRGGGIGTAGHGFVEINVYPGAEIKGNTAGSTGGGASLKNCKFTMYGGEISGNTGKTGGGIYLYSDVAADILGGTITNNTANIGSNDLTVTSSNWGTNSIYLYISDKVLIGNPAVYMEKNTKTVSPGDRNIKLHNASGDSITALSAASVAKGWNAPIATFWAQRDGAANLTVGGLKLNADQQGKTLPVYVLTQKTGEDGKPASSDAPIGIYAATVDADGSVNCTLPGGDVNGSGCAVAIVQPTLDYGSVVITGPNKITENKTAATYEVPYTATYTMSQNLASVIEQSKENINEQTCKFTFVVELDSRLTAKTGAGDYVFTSPIFDVDTVTGSGSTLTVTCKLKDKWTDHISELTTTPMTLTGTGVLDAADFAAGDTLATTGNIQVTIPGSNIFIPANTCLTEMAALVEYTITASAGSNGSISPSGKVSVPEGDSKTFTITPDSGYRISDVLVDGVSIGVVSTYTFKDVNANHTITVTFNKPSGGSSSSSKPSTILNTEDHYSYIVGYQDGTLQPYGDITRGQVATIFFRLLTDETRDAYWSQTNNYSDCGPNLWCNNAISTLSNMGIIDGYADGTFRPYGKITRAQFAKMAVGFFETATKEYQGYYSDVPEDAWYTDYVEAASRVGLIQGFQDGTFRPDANITRAQACVIVNRALNRKPDEDHLLPEKEMITWTDNNPGDWFYADMQEATNSHDYTWLSKGSEKKYMEDWTKKLEQRDWAAFEHAWSTAHSAPGGEVAK